MNLSRPTAEEVDHLLLNAQLRDEIEPFWDESVAVVDLHQMTTPRENQYLASMLAWERAPVLPISQWFQPELKLPPPELLDDSSLRELLWQTIGQLYEKRIVLAQTEHLCERQLYCLIQRDILPACEKKLELTDNYLYWQCLDPEIEVETWLRYYATRDERSAWALETDQPVPPMSSPPYPRRTPRPDHH